MAGVFEQVGWFIVGPDGIAGSNFRKTFPKWGTAVPAFVEHRGDGSVSEQGEHMRCVIDGEIWPCSTAVLSGRLDIEAPSEFGSSAAKGEC